MSRHLPSLLMLFFVAALPSTMFHIARSDLQSPDFHLAAFALLIHPPIPGPVSSCIDFAWDVLMSSALPLAALTALEGNSPLDRSVFASAARRVPAQLGFTLMLFVVMIPLVIIMAFLYSAFVSVQRGLVHVGGTMGDATSSLFWFLLTLLITILAFPVIVVASVVLTEIALNGRRPIDAWRNAVATLRQPNVRLGFAQLVVWAFDLFLLLQLLRALAFQVAVTLKLPLLAFILPLVLNLPVHIFATLVFVEYWAGVITAKRLKPSKPTKAWHGARSIAIQLVACSIALYAMVHPHDGVSWHPEFGGRPTIYSTLAECERSARVAAVTIPGFPTTCFPRYALQLGW